MGYLYHLVPKKLVGEVLIPLSSLRTELPDRYTQEILKYNDHPQRKLLPLRILRKLNCPQEEVLHFSPIHPHLIFEGLKSVFPDWNYSSNFFEIPIERIRGIPAILFDMNRTGTYVFGEDEPEEMFDWVTPDSYRILTSIPSEAIEFYKQWKARGERGAPAMARIPHVMVRGRVSISDCKIIDWKDRPESH
ncbi:hypothetical protein D3C87_571930 [compost metagenome]